MQTFSNNFNFFHAVSIMSSKKIFFSCFCLTIMSKSRVFGEYKMHFKNPFFPNIFYKSKYLRFLLPLPLLNKV